MKLDPYQPPGAVDATDEPGATTNRPPATCSGADALALGGLLDRVPAVRALVHRVLGIEPLEALLDPALEVPLVAGRGAGGHAVRGRGRRTVGGHARAVVHAALLAR